MSKSSVADDRGAGAMARKYVRGRPVWLFVWTFSFRIRMTLLRVKWSRYVRYFDPEEAGNLRRTELTETVTS